MEVFIDEDYLVLRGKPLELYNLIEDMDEEMRIEAKKVSNIYQVCKALSSLELEEEHEIRIKIV